MSAIVNADASDGDDVQVASLTLRRPIYCMAPMVGQSDRPFRLLCRRHGTTLCYSEMLMADEFASSAAYRHEALGDRVRDHPLIVQFAANEPDAFARAAVAAHAMGAAGADLNIGCPQRRAREGFYGSWMQEDWDLCCAIIAAARAACPRGFAITAKLRVQYCERGTRPSTERTVEFARRLVAAGADLIALHARVRGSPEQRRAGAADLAVVRALVDAGLGVPILSNGNVRSREDVALNLKATGADGVMVAEELLRDPSLFAPEKISAPALVGEYLDLLRECDIPREDGSVSGCVEINQSVGLPKDISSGRRVGA
jgi:tRNA-dihydrouridine synthase 1